MCGRFVSSQLPDHLAEFFGATNAVAGEVRPSWNVAPTQSVFVLFEAGGERLLDAMRWGLVPHWAKSLTSGPAPINARAETVAEKPSFKSAFKERRCILPADGFYEWQKQGSGPKQPYYIRPKSGDPLALAGIWGSWRDPETPESEPLRTCAIITTEPNQLMAELHNRMPVLLPPDVWTEWLDPANSEVEELDDLLAPAPDGVLEARPISRRVNNVRENGPELIERVG